MSKLKQLQSNFTTVEQSKRLLELGVPADSADCFFGGYGGHPDYVTKRQTDFEIEDDALFRLNPNLTPCWSVGRLMEIAKICAKEKEYYYASLNTVVHQEDFVEWWVKYFTLTDNVLFDFSKLEE